MPGNWSHVEVEAAVAAYFDMLELELRGEPFNKSERRRRLKALLNNRSEGSIELKHQNISAILIELGFSYIRGYKPRSNYQRLLFDLVADRLSRSPALQTSMSLRAEEPVFRLPHPRTYLIGSSNVRRATNREALASLRTRLDDGSARTISSSKRATAGLVWLASSSC